MTKDTTRDALVHQYADYARSLVIELARSLPHFVPRDEMTSAGLAGLVEAATRFDGSRGVHFKTFAYYRVRGAVYDYVRKAAALDPYHRSKISALAAVDDAVESQLEGRARTVTAGPADAASQLASVLDVAAAGFSVGECAAALHSEPGEGTDPLETAAQREQAAVLHDALKQLPEKERTMLHAVYFQGLTIEEAGKALGLSKSWSSRLHARALGLARGFLPESPG